MYNSIKDSLKNGKQRIQEINAGSMADIAFLLLIFFLVTTTLSNDMGIMRKLPPPGDVPPKDLHKRNVMQILVNRDNKLLVRGKEIHLFELRDKTKEFISNPKRESTLPKIEIMYVNELGNVPVSKHHIISLMSDRGTTYETYIAVQNELTAAYNELRNEYAMTRFNVHYKDLAQKKQKAINQVYPLHLSEAEPN